MEHYPSYSISNVNFIALIAALISGPGDRGELGRCLCLISCQEPLGVAQELLGLWY